MKKITFNYIESEVYDYHKTLKEIDKINSNMLNHDKGSIDMKSSHLVEHRRLNKMSEITDAIRTVYDELISEKQDLIRVYYWERPNELTWDGIANEMAIGRATALRWRKSFIENIARELGVA